MSEFLGCAGVASNAFWLMLMSFSSSALRVVDAAHHQLALSPEGAVMLSDSPSVRCWDLA